MEFLDTKALEYLIEHHKRAPYGYPDIEEWFKKVLLEKETREIIFVADLSGIIGMVILDCIEHKLCHLSVRRDCRRKGTGMYLYKKALDFFKSIVGVSKIFAQGSVYSINSFLSFADGYHQDKYWKVIGTTETDCGRPHLGKDIIIEMEL